MNVLAFISSSAAQIYEIHILIISLSIRTTVAIVLFCFVFFLRPSYFFGPSGSRDKYEKERGYKKQQRALSPSPIVAESV